MFTSGPTFATNDDDHAVAASDLPFVSAGIGHSRASFWFAAVLDTPHGQQLGVKEFPKCVDSKHRPEYQRYMPRKQEPFMQSDWSRSQQ